LVGVGIGGAAGGGLIVVGGVFGIRHVGVGAGAVGVGGGSVGAFLGFG
jgi:hypothetical protein